MFDLCGKKAIVVGASRGLGKAMAEALMEAGAETVLWARKLTPTALLDEYISHGFVVHTVFGDISTTECRMRTFSNAIEILEGRIDILVNAAGVQYRCFSEDFPMDEWKRILEINLTATFDLCKAAGALMLAQGSGKIINIASMLSFFGGYTVPAYAASKDGVAQLTKALSNEWAGRGVNVNAIAPGYMDTDMNTALIDDEVRNREILSRIPAHRWGKPEDMKGATVFLASSASDYLHGIVLPVDGGYLGR